MDASTLRRWRPSGSKTVAIDRRPLAEPPAPAHNLTEAERQAIVDVCTRSKFSSLPPSQIVPKLADRSKYIASESSFYRVLRDEGLLQHRRDGNTPHAAGQSD